MSKVLFITGASRGFGRIWTEEFLKRGDKVAAAARNTKALNDLENEYGENIFAVQLDITDRDACFEAVQKVKDHYGVIDVLINNAGYGLFGTIEETSEKEARDQMETNFFGTLWMTQAVLPIMRSQRSGHIIQVSSFLGLVTLPILGVYNASKFAVEGFSETLASEIKDFGIHVTLLEPNGYATDWSGASSYRSQTMEIYDPVRKAFADTATPDVFGIPEATTKAITQLVDSDNPPLRLLLGKIAYPTVKLAYEDRLASFEKWNNVSVAAHGR
jgi:short-subunit dehydrogenase